MAWTIVLVGVVGTFGLKFPVVLTAMAKEPSDRPSSAAAMAEELRKVAGLDSGKTAGVARAY